MGFHFQGWRITEQAHGRIARALVFLLALAIFAGVVAYAAPDVELTDPDEATCGDAE